MRQGKSGQVYPDAKIYFAPGSIRNSPHDEEFFHVFGQYLDEAIAKLKEQRPEDD